MAFSPDFSIDEFDYPLPESKIAQFPLEQRDASKLLVWKDGLLTQDVFSNIGNHLPRESILVFNDTKVIRARILFPRSTGSVIEIFCLDPVSPVKEMQSALSLKESVTWECLIGNAKRWKSGPVGKMMDHHGRSCILSAEKKENRGDGCFLVEFKWQPVSLTFAEILEMAGQVPLPPYIKRAADEDDTSGYQTIYAKNDGSVAAPTAGLHFTEELLAKLRKSSLFFSNVTLHVGLGTFRPVSTSDIALHRMHEEKISVGKDTIELILGNPERTVIAAGTTSVRTLESLYWVGVKAIVDKTSRLPDVCQWDPYDPKYNRGIPAGESLNYVLEMLKKGGLQHYSGETKIIIVPGYEFRLTGGMITNFHLPKSTLLMLIAAFAGTSWRSTYEYALQHDFRFLSYGDASLFLKTKL